MQQQHPATYGEAIEMGYSLGDTAWTRGYVSRRSEQVCDDTPIHVAGGSRQGELYVLMPSWESTTYCRRQYLTGPKNKKQNKLN